MRRDFYPALLFAGLLHLVFFLSAGTPSRRQMRPPSPSPARVLAVVPPVPEPDPADPDPDPGVAATDVVPSLPDVPPPAAPAGPTQEWASPAPAAPEAATPAIRIPVDRGPGGGGSTVFDPAMLDQLPVAVAQSAPAYPSALKQQGIEGTVTVDFIVDASGRVHGAYALAGGREEFGAAAVAAVAKWRFRPGVRHGRPVSTHLQIPIVFSIRAGE